MKRLIYLLAILTLISCGESEYQKKLKLEIESVNRGITIDSTMSVFWENKLDSVMMSLNGSNPTLMQQIMIEKEKVERELKLKKQKKSDLELELAKTKD